MKLYSICLVGSIVTSAVAACSGGPEPQPAPTAQQVAPTVARHSVPTEAQLSNSAAQRAASTGAGTVGQVTVRAQASKAAPALQQ